MDLRSILGLPPVMGMVAEPDPEVKLRELLAKVSPADIRAEIARREAEARARQAAEDITPDDVMAEQCRRSLAKFSREAWKVLHPSEPLQWSWHHDALCDHLQWLLECWIIRKTAEAEWAARCERAKLLREPLPPAPTYKQPARQMVINLPPSTLKTEIMMVFAPAWMWTKWPSWRVLCLSCNPRVALDSASLSRRVIESPWYARIFKPDWKLLEDKNAKSDFGTTVGGARQSHGMTAAVVGEHADAIFVDDPTDPKEVTRAALEKANNDWPGIRNRVTDEGSSIRVIIQQRLDVDDLSGFVTKGKKGKAWIRIVLPLEFVPKRRCASPMPVDADNRLTMVMVDGERPTWRDPRIVKDELLQPERFQPDVLEELKDNAGPYGWMSQYQQDPTPREGIKVKRKWFGFFRLADHHAGDCPRPEGCRQPEDPNGAARVIPRRGTGWAFDSMFVTVDPANKKTDAGSLWGMLAVGIQGARKFVLDDPSRRGEIDEILEVLRQLIRTWKPRTLLIEDTAAGPTLLKTLREELGAGKIKDENGRAIVCQIRALTPKEVGGDKEARLSAVINQFAAELIYLLEGAPWLADFVDELTMFPNFPTKDRVDALTALLAIVGMSNSAAWVELFQDAEPPPPDPDAPAPIVPESTHDHYYVDGVCVRCLRETQEREQEQAAARAGGETDHEAPN